ncbi:MAG: hypothetical protein QM754_07690 [Tepidisphaeraceae bacterium]
MTQRIAAILGLIAFATCVVQGLFAENSFPTVIWRALQALVVCLLVGGILGVVLEKILKENLGANEKAENSASEPGHVGR